MVRAKARGSTRTRVLELGIYIIISALVGAKLLLLVTDFRRSRRNPARAAHAGAFGRRVLRRPHPRGRRRALVHPARRSPVWTTCDVFARASRSPRRRTASDVSLRAAATANRRRSRGHHVSPIRSRRATSGRRSASRCIHTALRGRAELLILIVLLVTGAQRAAVPRANLLALHAALRRFAVHHRVLPRRRARHGVHVLDLAVHSLLLAPLAIVMPSVSRVRRRPSRTRPESCLTSACLLGITTGPLRCRGPKTGSKASCNQYYFSDTAASYRVICSLVDLVNLFNRSTKMTSQPDDQMTTISVPEESDGVRLDGSWRRCWRTIRARRFSG